MSVTPPYWVSLGGVKWLGRARAHVAMHVVTVVGVVAAKRLVDMLVVMCAECVGGARGVGVGWVEVGGVAAL